MSYREKLKRKVVESIDSSGEKGKSLYGVLVDAFDTDDLAEMGIDVNIVFRILEELLEEDKVILKEEPGIRVYFSNNVLTKGCSI